MVPKKISKRKNPDRTESGSYSRSKVGVPRKLSSLTRLVRLLQKEGIRFQIAGMSAALLQGVPATTLNTDIWVDVKERPYGRILQLCKNLGAEILAPTVVALEDGSLVNFLYRVDGLQNFEMEWRRSLKIQWMKTIVHVLPLKRIIQSKKRVGRPKDMAHLPLLNQVLKLKKKTSCLQ